MKNVNREMPLNLQTMLVELSGIMEFKIPSFSSPQHNHQENHAFCKVLILHSLLLLYIMH